MQRRLVLLSLAGLLACDGGSDAPKPEAPAAPKAEAKAPAAEEPEKQDEPEAAKPKKAAPKLGKIPHKRPKPSQKQIDEAKARATSFQEHLDAGRKASKAKAFDEAFAQLTKARELRPHNASVLGELGYASYKAGKLDEARRWTEDAISRTDNPRKLGALFYNLGLIADGQGDKAGAKLHYEVSLEHRDNTTVESKLAALSDIAPTKGPDTLEAYCAAQTKQLRCISDADVKDIQKVEPDFEYWCGCEVHEHVKSTTPEGSIQEAAIVNVGYSEIELNMEFDSVLLVRTANGGWQEAHSVLNSWMKEFCDSDTDEGAIMTVEFRDVSPDPGLELVSTWRHYFNDMPDMDSDETDQVETSRSGTILCGGSEPRCASWETEHEVVRGEFWQWEMRDPVTTASTLTESFDAEKGLTLSLDKGKGKGKGKHERWEGLVGTHSFAELFSKRLFRPKRLR